MCRSCGIIALITLYSENGIYFEKRKFVTTPMHSPNFHVFAIFSTYISFISSYISLFYAFYILYSSDVKFGRESLLIAPVSNKFAP